MGGCGSVYAAVDVTLGREVALKRVRPDRAAAGDDGGASRALLREAQALARLSHPNVVTVFEAGAIDDEVFIAMQWVKGVTLREWIAEARPPWRRALATIVHAGRGLAAAHEAGLVHRDFKPDNVIVRDDGGVVVVDFGLAQALREPLTTSDRAATGLVGTPRYMAPEQHDRARATAAADQYAVCVTLFEALWGRTPWPASAERDLPTLRDTKRRGGWTAPRGRIPAAVGRAVCRGLAPDPADRWPSLGVLLDALVERPQRRRRLVGVALVTVFVGVVLIGAAFQALMYFDYLSRGG